MKSLSVFLSLILTVSLVNSGCSKTNLPVQFDNIAVSAMVADANYNQNNTVNNQVKNLHNEPVNAIRSIEQKADVLNPQASYQAVNKVDKIVDSIDLDTLDETRDINANEITSFVNSNSFIFEDDTEMSFSTESLKTIFDKVKTKINDWRQKGAMKKFDKAEKFAEENNDLAKELDAANALKGKERTDKLKALKAQYPTAYDKWSKRIAVNRWLSFSKKNPELAADIVEYSKLPADQKPAKLTELKAKYPKFFKTA